MNQRGIWAAVETIPSRHAREIRAQSIAGRMAVRGLFLPAQGAWIEDFRRELLEYPSSRWDDCVDLCSLLGQLLDHLSHGSAPNPKEEQKRLMIGGVSTVCMEDLWKEEERRSSKYRSSGRIK